DLKEIKFIFSPRLWFAGKDMEIDEYSVSLDLKDSSFLFLPEENDLRRLIETYSFLNFDKLLNGIALDRIDGQIIYDSSKKLFSINDLEFYLDNNSFKFDGRYKFLENSKEKLYARIRSAEMNLSYFDDFHKELSISGRSAFDLTATGSIDEADIDLNLSIPELHLNEILLENMVSKIRLYNNRLYLDNLNLVLDGQNQLDLDGFYNIVNKEYSFDMEGREIDIDLLQKMGFKGLRDSLDNISGRAEINASLTGKGTSLAGANITGEMMMEDFRLDLRNSINTRKNSSAEININRLSTDFYLSDNIILFRETSLLDEWGELNLSGELFLENLAFDFDIFSDSVYLSLLPDLLLNNLPKGKRDELLSGEAKIVGNITNKKEDLLFGARVEVPEGSYHGYSYKDLTASILYQDTRLSIEDISLLFSEKAIEGQGVLEFLTEGTYLDFNVLSRNLEYDILYDVLQKEDIIEDKLPFSGEIGFEASIDGYIDNPLIFLKLDSNNTNLDIKGSRIAFDTLNADIEHRDQNLYFHKVSIRNEEGYLMVEGLWDYDKFDLEYTLNDYPIDYILNKILDIGNDVDGFINIDGTINGPFSDLEMKGNILANALTYQGKDFGNLNGEVTYCSNNISVENFLWQYAGGKYNIEGEISDLLDNTFVNLSLNTVNASLDDIPIVDIPEVDSLENYVYDLKADMRGFWPELSSQTDIIVTSDYAEDEIIKLSGEVSRYIDMEIKGQNFSVDKFLEEFTGLNFEGNMQFDGYLQGEFDNLTMSLDTSIVEGYLEDIMAEKITGNLSFVNMKDFHLDQEIFLSDESGFSFQGFFPIKDGPENFQFAAESRDFPLEIVSGYDPSWPDFSGNLSGEINYSGGIKKPSFYGNIDLDNGIIDVDLPDKFDEIEGKIILDGERIKIDKVSASYGEGNFVVEGDIRPFFENENYNLQISGDNLNFDYGSFNGFFDPDVIVTGPIDKPLISGDILTHDLIVGLPIESEESEGNMPIEFDLYLYPGENVLLSNDNMDILVQEGSLNLIYIDEEMDIIGELTSRQGRFDFYNNIFILEDGRANFSRSFYGDDGLIPNISARARTNVGGTRINVQLTGKATNMIATFTSPTLDNQDEILLLLTQRGGLGELISGNWGGILETELFRMLQNRFQLNFIENIQESFRDIFELDRFEVNTYNLGWNNEVTIYLGKYINDRLYLEYSDVFKSDIDNIWGDVPGELSLQYYLNDDFTLKGNWMGDDEYSFSIETNIEF
ncbi:MAG: translocation/assembly module TamB domain-containing protein, partial [bacterium]